MKFYILASLIIFILVIFHNIRKSKKQFDAEEMSFWEKERKSNEVRRKSLDGLDYVKIPLDQLPMHLMEDNEKVADCHRMIKELALQPIVNLTGLSNTDLKLEYGTANITILTEYDQNYTLLVSTLQRWADLLYTENHVAEAGQILEFAVSTRTDVCRTYDMLSDIYVANWQTHKIDDLIATAKTLNSLNREVILRHLDQKSDHS